MTGGSKTFVNLDSGLDTSSSDMLVHVGQATFQHNWQKPQGKYLPNSLRFEKNGWAAGWNVFNFEYNTFEMQIDDITLTGSKYNEFAVVLSVRKTDFLDDKSIVVVPQVINKNEDLTVEGNVITGTINDKTYHITFNNGVFSIDNPYVGLNAVQQADYSFSLVVYDILRSFECDFDFYLPSEMSGTTIKSQGYAGFDDDVHRWGDYTYGLATGKVYFKGEEITPVVTGNHLSFEFDMTVTDEYFNIRTTLESRYYEFVNCVLSSNNASIISGSELSNMFLFNTYNVSLSTTRLIHHNHIDVDVCVPVWLTIVVNGSDFHVYHNNVDASDLYDYTYAVAGWALASNDADCWLSSASFSGSSFGTVTLSTDVLPFKNNAIYYRNANGEQVISVPLEGHLLYRLRYKKISSLVELVQNNFTKNTSEMDFIKVPSSSISDSRIYVDRDDVDKSYAWFTMSPAGFTPDNSGGSGSFAFSLNGDIETTASVLFYAGILSDPGFFAPPVVSGGNLLTATSFFMTGIEWVPDAYEFPIDSLLQFSNKNTYKLGHAFYDNVASGLTILKRDIVELDNLMVDISYYFGDIDINVKYNVLTKAYTLVGTGFDIAGAEVSFLSITGTTINCSIALGFSNEASFAVVDNGTLHSIAGGIAEVECNSVLLHYNYTTQQLLEDYEYDKVIHDGYHSLSVSYVDKRDYNIVLPFTTDGSLSGTVLTFTYQGHEYTFDISELSEAESFVNVLSTDVRNPSDTEVIGKLNVGKDSVYQLVRQQWNSTSEVENFWWIDSRHILVLTKTHFIYRAKTADVDDWNGDRWTDIYALNRSEILPSNVTVYLTTDFFAEGASSGHALFLAFEIDTGRIKCRILDPEHELSSIYDIYFEVRRRKLGEVLNDVSYVGNTGYFNTYSETYAGFILHSSKWTATIRDGKLIIGCHSNNNYNQWATVVNLSTGLIEKCIQGYGYVGNKGDLTGGQIPQMFFDVNKGFGGRVDPLFSIIKRNENIENIDDVYEVNDLNRLNKFDDKVVGDAEQQWYIARQNYGVVSHLVYKGGVFIAEILPITNNYDSIYKSPSFMSALIGDFVPTPYGMDSMFQFDGAGQAIWAIFTGLLGDPQIWMFQPRQSVFAYLQQTFGQYAVVHYNSSRSLPKDESGAPVFDDGTGTMQGQVKKNVTPLLSEAHAFDKQVFSQQSKVSVKFGGFLNIIALFLDATFSFARKDSVNEEQNQSAISDIGRKYQTFFVENVENMISNNIHSQSNSDVGIVSRIAGIKSLDMFYSTCDNQSVHAGPGYVEHQFVADCVAQSTTEVGAEGKVIQMAFCIKVLSTIVRMVGRVIMDNIIKFLKLQAEAIGSASIFTVAVAEALLITAQALEALVVAQDYAWDMVEEICDSINAKGMQSNVAGYVSRHSLTVEGKHKYGEKNETFMWPCWGVASGELEYTDTQVVASVKCKPWQLTLATRKLSSSNFIDALSITEQSRIKYSSIDPFSLGTAISNEGDLATVVHNHEGKVPLYVASCYGQHTKRKLPDRMVKIEGVASFLPEVPFKNENIGASDPVFPPSMFHDYIIDERWGISKCATMGLDQWVACKDTKVINCPPSNMVITDDFCGVACSYTAVEVKRGLSKRYMRPWAITPNVLAFNCTGLNSIYDNKLYHAFDGISYRITNWTGASGLGMEKQTYLYSFQVNDRFKRSNKFPANEMLGNFNSDPDQAVETIDRAYTLVTCAAKEKGLEAGTIGEDKDLTRWALPIFTERVTTLPAAVKTLTAMPLAVVDGVTSLCTDIANNQAAYKAPVSVDFTLGKNVYRLTEDYICSVQTQAGVDVVTNLVPALGLQYIGATPLEAYFYSKATRCYYIFNGGTSLVKAGMLERFRDVQSGFWDFVNQEVVMPCLMTYKRLNSDVEDKDTETDNIIVPVLSNDQVSGELAPPITTIFNDTSWYHVASLPSGLAYQGPNRVVINRSIFVEYMLDTLRNNLGKWKKIDKSRYATKRGYMEKFRSVVQDVHGVDGWTHNQFVLVTSPLGAAENVDCMFEWEITFCWPIEMDLIYDVDNFACVCIAAETMTPGGKLKSKPTHVYLTKELFTRTGNYGYYTFRYQSKHGSGNRERLHIWSDQYIAISSIVLESKIVSDRRSEQLTQQLDVQKLKEL